MLPVWRRAIGRGWIGVAIAGAVFALLAQLRAQPAIDDAIVSAADKMLADAMHAGDKAAARRLLSLQFTFVDELGAIHERRDFLADLKAVSAEPAADAKVQTYGRIAMVTGQRKSARGNDTFFLDIWARQKGTWRALTMQEVVLGQAGNPATPATTAATPYECKNPCQTIPYRVRSPTEQDIITAFQTIKKAVIDHNAGEWGRNIADEFVFYGSDRAPADKAARIAEIDQQKTSNAVVTVDEIQSMRLTAFENGAAMTVTQSAPGESHPANRTARIWVRREGRWQMAISVQTDIKP